MNIVVKSDIQESIADTLVFPSLEWKGGMDDIGQFAYMQAPPMPPGYSVDSILSVSIYLFDFDWMRFIWKAISKDGSDTNYFYYKIERDTLIVYVYYSGFDPFNSFYIGSQIKVVFR